MAALVLCASVRTPVSAKKKDAERASILYRTVRCSYSLLHHKYSSTTVQLATQLVDVHCQRAEIASRSKCCQCLVKGCSFVTSTVLLSLTLPMQVVESGALILVLLDFTNATLLLFLATLLAVINDRRRSHLLGLIKSTAFLWKSM